MHINAVYRILSARQERYNLGSKVITLESGRELYFYKTLLIHKPNKAFREVCLNHRNDRQRNPAARAEKCAMGVSLLITLIESSRHVMARFRVKGVVPADGL